MDGGTTNRYSWSRSLSVRARHIPRQCGARPPFPHPPGRPGAGQSPAASGGREV